MTRILDETQENVAGGLGSFAKLTLPEELNLALSSMLNPQRFTSRYHNLFALDSAARG
jgi:hypothetical protein